LQYPNYKCSTNRIHGHTIPNPFIRRVPACLYAMHGQDNV